ncbi:uncharacterized protein H6S33_013172 [Morchella sextelata]|uniref:uncharacterized protein n=1 Tax=Morchella sextelata TaxID=1174677 RepID=UPI001D054357|nr:uncharacterized protein H6S33_013172 [Morchella sextelata]KAH0609686.1 hypothetical protein H6S33_013172 [Morchella sextelata]
MNGNPGLSRSILLIPRARFIVASLGALSGSIYTGRRGRGAEIMRKFFNELAECVYAKEIKPKIPITLMR